MIHRRVTSVLNLRGNAILSTVKELGNVGPLYSTVSAMETLPRKLKKAEKKPWVTSVNELKRRARFEKQERRVVREVALRPPENGLLVEKLIPVAHRVLASRAQLLACVSRISEEIPIYFCSLCTEVHVGHPPHKIRTCDVSGSQKNKEHTWQRGGVDHVLPVVQSFHLYDRLGRAVSHNERLEVDRIPALVELCIQAGVDLPEYPTRRRKFPIYRVAGKLIDFEKRFPKDDLFGKDVETFRSRETIKKHIGDGNYLNLPYDDIKGFAMRGMEAWETMRTGAIQLMKTYGVQTCGYCPELQVGPKGHRVRKCQAFKHQMRDGQHAWQEATIDDLLSTVYVWHVQNPHAGDVLVDSMKRYYGKLPAVVELFSQVGAQVGDDYYHMMRDDSGEYFAHLDASGRRVDLDQRPELTKGSVEFIAPAEYMVRPPMPPLYFFLIDVSLTAVRSGMLEVLAQTIKNSLDSLPGFPRTQIGFITYDSTVHFYNMKSSLTQPQMMVMSDLEDVFVPLPDDLLVNLSESRTVVDAFLDSLPSMFQDNVNVESAFGPALKTAFMVMNQLGGKLLIFQSSLPSLGVGRLKLRGDDVRVYGTDKEHTIRVPEDPFYKQMAADFTKYQIAVNVYAFSDKYTDIATIGTLAKYTGGQVYYYPSFQASVHKDRLRHELARDLTRETAWESVMRIRCGKGVRFTTYHGNFMLRSTDLIALPAVDCDKAYAMQLSLEETLLTSQTVFFQIALLYTSSSGERRIRVHTAAAPVVSDLGEMYRLADTGAIISLFTRLAIEKTLTSKLEEARNSIQLRIVKALREYRNLHAVQHRVAGRMIYPESLKYLPLYGLALCKTTALRGGYADAQLDERCAAGYTMMALPVKRLLKLLYPKLIRIDEYLLKKPSSREESKDILKGVPLTTESLDPQGLYLFDDGFRFVIWFGRMLSPNMIQSLLGENFAADFSKVSLQELDNEMSRELMGLLKRQRESDRSYYQLCHLVRQGEQPREGFFLLANLIEDPVGGSIGYQDWILQVHRQVQQNA